MSNWRLCVETGVGLRDLDLEEFDDCLFRFFLLLSAFCRSNSSIQFS